MGTSVHTISTHLILDSSIQPFSKGFFWKKTAQITASSQESAFLKQLYRLTAHTVLTPGRRSEYFRSWVSNTKNLSLQLQGDTRFFCWDFLIRFPFKITLGNILPAMRSTMRNTALFCHTKRGGIAYSMQRQSSSECTRKKIEDDKLIDVVAFPAQGCCTANHILRQQMRCASERLACTHIHTVQGARRHFHSLSAHCSQPL